MSVAPPSMEELESVRLLTLQGVQQVWGPDRELEARNRWQESDEKGGPFAHDRYSEDLKSARQTGRVPPIYVRRVEQVRPDLYPHMRVQDYDWQRLPLGFSQSNISEEEFWAFRHQRCFVEFHDWLAALPLQREEKVFHALDSPTATIILEWGLFIDHWDFLVGTGSPYTCNIVDDDPDWFLFFHRDDIAVYGCSLEYAASRSISVQATIEDQESFYDAFRIQSDSVRAEKRLRDFELIKQEQYLN